MEMLCPECLGPLVTGDGKTAVCTLHGGRYGILFLRGQAVVPLPLTRPLVEAAVDAVLMNGEAQADNPYRAPVQHLQTCVNHPGVQTEQNCELCGKAICLTCAFPQRDGTSLCPDCVGKARVFTPAASEVAAGICCTRHPQVQAVHYCKSCRKPVCSTCDFALAGGVHVCPDCATKSNRELSATRKTTLGWSFALAVWCTVGVALLLSGVFAEAAMNRESAEVFGFVVSLLVFMPALIGTGLSLGTLDRRLANPPMVWVAIVWNISVLAVLLLLTLIGLFVA